MKTTCRVPILVEVVLRAWGTDDPRLLPLLRAENQPGAHQRQNAVGGRAKAAGWPLEASTMMEARRNQRVALLRLEGIDYTPSGQRDRHRRSVAAAAAYRDDDTVSIFDE